VIRACTLAGVAAAMMTAPALAAEPSPTWGVATTRVEPVADLASIDVKALRRSRTLTSVAFVAPAVNHVGFLATSPLLEADTLDASGGGALGLTSLGALGMLVVPAWLDGNAQRSRRTIASQGGSVRKVSAPVLTAVLSVVPIVLRGLPEAGEDTAPGQVALAYASYAAVVALPLNQLRHNRLARRRAGWLEGT